MRKIALLLDPQQVEMIVVGLNELPRKFSEPLIRDIQRQIDAGREDQAAALSAEAKEP